MIILNSKTLIFVIIKVLNVISLTLFERIVNDYQLKRLVKVMLPVPDTNIRPSLSDIDGNTTLQRKERPSDHESLL